MDSGPPRKRPWEEDDQALPPIGRRASLAANDQSGHLLPHLSGWHNTWDHDHRTLPPIYPPPCGASAEHAPSSLLRTSSHHSGPYTGRPKLRSQSLFDVYQPKRQRTEYSGEPPTTSYLDQDPDLLSSSVPGLLDAPEPDRDRRDSCCSPDCQGQTCTSIRAVVQKLASELNALDSKVRYLLRSGSHTVREPPPESETSGTERVLHWALGIAQWNSLQLRDHAERLVNPNVDHEIPQRDPTTTLGSHEIMKRTLPYSDAEENSPASKSLSKSITDFQRLLPSINMPDDSRRSLYGSEYSASTHSPRTATSSYLRGGFAPPHSPLQSSQSIQSGMLPSPSSMNFPNPAILPPISPPHSHVQTSTQASHLQDLQHQVSIKTLAYQTLQREYDSLLQKLERQRTKCATLEKKFEVSDVEINSLTDEKEKLQVQIAGFEAQVEELQQSRDEARRQLVANGAQYMRIMEMASRLQAQGAEDRRHWEVEKGELEGRIKTLEEAMVTGPEWPDASHRNEPGRGNLAPSPPMSSAWQMSSSTSSSAETVTVLRAEIGRLRARTQSLEQALQAMRDESVSIQVAAQTIVASGGKMKEAIDTGLGE